MHVRENASLLDGDTSVILSSFGRGPQGKCDSHLKLKHDPHLILGCDFHLKHDLYETRKSRWMLLNASVMLNVFEM